MIILPCKLQQTSLMWNLLSSLPLDLLQQQSFCHRTQSLFPASISAILQKEMVSTMSPCKTMPCGRNESDEVPESDNNATQEKNAVTSEVAAEESHVQENTNEHTSEVTSDVDNQAPTLPPNQCSSSLEGSMGVLNQDILEEIIRQALAMYPYMRQPLRAVSRFFRDTVDKQPLPKVYIPEL